MTLFSTTVTYICITFPLQVTKVERVIELEKELLMQPMFLAFIWQQQGLIQVFSAEVHVSKFHLAFSNILGKNVVQ